jgi:rhamnose transport system substrate-binding protein
MLMELKEPKYQKIKLVDTVYGDDDDARSYQKMLGLLKSHPNLKGVISPTSVGIAAGARAITDAGAIGKVVITGLGIPSQLRRYVHNGACPKFVLWNPVDLGYLTAYVTHRLIAKEIKGLPGEKFAAGRLGEYTVAADRSVLLGKPFVFDRMNVDDAGF